MSFFIQTVEYTESSGQLREFYESDIKSLGVPSNTTRSLSLRPEIWEAYMGLVRAIRRSMPLREYELATFAAAAEMGCTICMLAHGAILRKNGVAAEQLATLAKDLRAGGLDEKEVALMEYAQKVVRDAGSTTSEDFDRLRGLGWSDVEILNITATAALRSFASKVFDALGADPDTIYKAVDEETRHALIGNRPFGA
jgi:uncharacterized peroxidase-related enzyme